MYMARGTTLKELYLDLDLLDDDHWKVLGTIAGWAQRNQERLMNTVFVGGDPAKGQVYGYVSWVDGRAILTVRNPDRRSQTLQVPFDGRAYFRGESGQPYRARAVYPYVEDMPWAFHSGEDIRITAPGDTVTVYEIDPGEPMVTEALTPPPLPEAEASTGDTSFHIEIAIPDEEFKRYDLHLQPATTADTAITINGKPVREHRTNTGGRWSISSYDLRRWRGESLSIEGKLLSLPDTGVEGKTVKLDAWIIADRKVNAPDHEDEGLPFLISQKYRRLTQQILNTVEIEVAGTSNETPLARKITKAKE